MKRFIQKFKKLKLTSPYIISVIIVVYGILSYISCTDSFFKTINQKISCSYLSLFVWILLSFAVYLGSVIKKDLQKLAKAFLFLCLTAMLIALFHAFTNFLFALITFVFLLFIAYYLLFYEKKYVRCLSAGILLILISFGFTGIPLLEKTHENYLINLNPLFIAGYGLIFFSLVFLWPKYKKIWAIFIFLSVLSTYRAFIALSLLTLILLYSKRKISGKKEKVFLVIGIVMFLVLVFISEYFVRASMHTFWKLDEIRSGEYRLAFTFSTFDKIIEKSLPLGYSFMATLFSITPGKLICNIAYSCNSNINAGIFAPFFIDLGVFSFVIFLLIGKMLRDSYERDFKIYAVISSILLSSIDIGINIYLLSLITLLWVKVLKNEKNP